MMDLRFSKTGIRIPEHTGVFSTFAMILVVMISAMVMFASQCSVDVKLLTLLLVWVYAVCYGVSGLEQKFAYLMFMLMIFVFLLSRPVFAQLYHLEWKKWSASTNSTVVAIIYVSVVALLIASKIAGSIKINISYPTKVIVDENELSVLRKALLAVITVTALAYYYARIKFFLSFNGSEYADMYLAYDSGMPRIVNALTYLFPIAVACFLSMEPNKKETAIVLIVYIGSGIPLFLLGNRGALVVPIVFSTVYVLARNTLDKDKCKWVTRKTKVAFIIFAVVAMALLGAMNYTRDGREVLDDSQMPLMADFLYKQGTTFDTLAQGIEYRNQIEELPGDFIYSLNDISEALSYGVIGRFLENKKPLPTGNSIQTVNERGALAHRLSYVVLKESYLSGHGRGSSYTIETFLDWGFSGVAIFSFIIGLFLSNILSLISSRNMIVRTIAINCLLLIYLMPRSEATRFISFIATPYYWIMIAFILFIRIAVGGGNRHSVKEAEDVALA